jgi:hypothetical protein
VAERPVALPPVRRSTGATLTNEIECDGYARECVRLAELTFEQQIREILLDMAYEWMAVAMDERAELAPKSSGSTAHYGLSGRDVKRPRTFDENVATEEAAERARMDNGESFQGPTISEPFNGEVSEDREGNGEWRVEYFDAHGGCYVTIFAGPAAENRARDYCTALMTGSLKICRGLLSLTVTTILNP